MGLFDGNKKAQEQANRIAQAALALKQRQGKQARQQAQRAAKADRRISRRQTAATVAAARANSSALADAVGRQGPLMTEYIDDTSLTRKRLAMGGRSPYGFSMGAGSGLGGMRTQLG